MRFSGAAAAALLAGGAMAAPTLGGLTNAQQAKVDQLKRLSKLLNQGQVQPFIPYKGKSNVTDSTVYSGNWGGAVINGNGITQVQATFTVPTVSLPSGDNPSNDYYGCAWVGIDGADSCSKGLWQAGAYWLYSNGGWEYFPFFEWYPGGVNAADMSISPGDSISVSVVATSTTSGVYTFTNHNSGQTVSGSLSNQPTLCQGTVEWIVEDNSASSDIMPDFGSVTFTNAQYTANGNIAGVSAANTYEVYDNDQQYTNCHTSGNNEVYCSWQD